jgi:hypothetical protein
LPDQFVILTTPMGPAPHCRQLSIKDTPGMPLTKSFGKLLYERATAEPAFAEAP